MTSNLAENLAHPSNAVNGQCGKSLITDEGLGSATGARGLMYAQENPIL